MTHHLTRWILCLTLLAPVGGARGDSVTHVLSGQESLATVAQHYYGDASWADGLRRYNALDLSDPAVGTVLVVPLPSVHPVVEGDSWESLAAQYWDDTALGKSLSEWCDAPGGELKPGQEIRIPVLLPHGLLEGESLATLSRRLTGGPYMAEALAELNRVDEPRRLAVGQVVRVPILDTPPVGASLPPPEHPAPEPTIQPLAEQEMTRVEPAASEPEASPLTEAQEPPPATPLFEPPMTQPEVSEEPSDFGPELRHAVAAYRAGDFEGARELLEALRPVILAEGSPTEQQLLLQQLTEVYAAFDESEPLCTSYRALLALDPYFAWDPDLTSPKIIRLTDGCRILQDF
jgi:hypothetical protein